MTTFDDRERRFENKHAHDEELAFKIHARRNKLLALWVAELLGMEGTRAEEYARGAVKDELPDKAGHENLVRKLLADLHKADIHKTAEDIHAKMAALLPVAKEQVEKK